MNATHDTPAISRAQTVYARWLEIGAQLGLVILIASFVIYLGQWGTPKISLSDLPQYWTLPVDAFLTATGMPAGWGWIAFLDASDVRNFVGVALLATVSLASIARVLILFLRHRDWIYAGISACQLVVLLLALVGVAGHH